MVTSKSQKVNLVSHQLIVPFLTLEAIRMITSAAKRRRQLSSEERLLQKYVCVERSNLRMTMTSHRRKVKNDTCSLVLTLFLNEISANE